MARILSGCVAFVLVLAVVVPLADGGSRVKKAKKRDQIVPPAQALETRINVDFQDTPLDKVIADLRAAARTNIVPDFTALANEGIDLRERYSLQARQISLKAALNLLMPQAGLTYVIENEVCLITTERRAHGKLKQATYNVADLIVPIAQDLPEAKAGRESTIEQQLIDMITSTIAPDSWESVGGNGAIRYYPVGMALVVTQAEDVHEQVADLLSALRRMQDLQVALEVKLVHISEAVLEKSGLELGTQGGEPTMLSDTQVIQLLELVQRDRHSNVMQAPKVTLFNGQHAKVQTTEEFSFVTEIEVLNNAGGSVAQPKTEKIMTGMQLSLQPVVAADRGSVRVAVGLKLAALDEQVNKVPVVTHFVHETLDGEEQQTPVKQYVQQPKVSTRTVEHKVAIPLGQTAVLDGGAQLRECRCEHGAPILSKIPYINRLYRTVGYARESSRLLILVTPHIHDQAEETEIFTDCASK